MKMEFVRIRAAKMASKLQLATIRASEAHLESI